MCKPIILKPNAGCAVCRGWGEFDEHHGPGLRERVICECVFDHAPQDAESQAQIDAGNFLIDAPTPPEDADSERYYEDN